jgi:thioester reductase-like protein
MTDTTIVLTGSTGHLGTYILDALLADTKVGSIHCLNRSTDAQARQEAQLTERGLRSLNQIGSAPVYFHTTDLTKPRLGLSDEVYGALTAHATHYIHCAWPVDFNKSLSSFEPSIQGLLNLMDLPISAPHQPVFMFLSSISAIGNWGAVPGARLHVPEAEVDDWKVARFGYGQSKLVAERLLAEATRVSHLKTSVCRIGQVCGPIEHGGKGCWPRQEWFPSLVASAKYLNAVPSSLGALDAIDWLPADRVGLMVAELLFCHQEPGTIAYHHLVNPTLSTWSTLLPRIKLGLQQPNIKVLTLVEWVDLLKDSMWDPVRNPAMKLLPFFHDLRDKVILVPNARAVILEVKATVQKSKVLRDTKAVQPEWLELWFKQWDFN